MKYEGLDLAVLKGLFLTSGPTPIERLVRQTPTGSSARRIWFLQEWLTSSRLSLPDAEQGGYRFVVNPEQQYTGEAVLSTHHRV